jgi:hypothetical protein
MHMGLHYWYYWKTFNEYDLTEAILWFLGLMCGTHWILRIFVIGNLNTLQNMVVKGKNS